VFSALRGPMTTISLYPCPEDFVNFHASGYSINMGGYGGSAVKKVVFMIIRFYQSTSSFFHLKTQSILGQRLLG
jgi:hypothetical protein